MQFHCVLVLRRSVVSASKHRMRLPHGSFLASHALLFSLENSGSAAFSSVSTKGRRAMGQPTSGRVKLDVSFRARAQTVPAKVISKVDGPKETPNNPAAHLIAPKPTSQTTFGNPLTDGVEVCSQWWISCFEKRGEAISDLGFPLQNIEIWVLAYQKVHLQVTGDRADREAISNRVTPRLRKLVDAILGGKYKWKDETHVFLASPEDHTTGEESSEPKVSQSPAFQDGVVQEAILLILEPIFEARFSSRSHASRPGRNVHTALKSIWRSCTGSCTVWFIKGDASILQESCLVTRILDSVVTVVRDSRVVFLLKSGLLAQALSKQKKEEKKGHVEVVKKGQVITEWGSFDRLMPFLCNVFLDRLDRWMDERIDSFVNKEHSSTRHSSSLLFKPAVVSIGKKCRMEYVRYGTQFLVATNGSEQEAEEFRKVLLTFLDQRLGIKLDRQLTLTHISEGLTFLDHSISRRVVHPIMVQRTASNGIIIQKKALGTALSIKASQQCCLSHLKRVGKPTSTKQIEELLEVLNNWFHYVENRKQFIQYCKFILCSSYAKQYYEEHKHLMKTKNYLNFFKVAMKKLDERIVLSDLQRVYPIPKEQNWVPEHEEFLRNLAWMQSQGALSQAADKLRKMEKISPQDRKSVV